MLRFLLPTTAALLLFLCSFPVTSQNLSRFFHSDLSALNQTRLTISPVEGKADLKLDLTTLILTWDVQFNGLLSEPVAAGLHGPAQPGANGLMFINIAPNGISSPLRGSAVVTEAEVQYLLAGWTYVNITTEKYPYGEARGQMAVGPRDQD